eukprot:m.877794 g.877794  ORF g.877794 m.877794 type:complete len:814 (+) comp23583_c0_seq12:281-2722(+)
MMFPRMSCRVALAAATFLFLGMDRVSGGSCQDFSARRFFQGSSYITFSLGVVQLLVCVYIISRHYIAKYRVKTGKVHNNTGILNPTYALVLLAYGTISGIIGLLNIMLEVKKYPDKDNAMVDSIVVGVAYGLFHSVLEGIGVFLCLQGLGSRALKKTLKYSLGIGAFFGGLQTFSYLFEYWAPNGSIEYGFAVKLGGEFLLFVGYLLLVVLPYRILSRRPAAVSYATFWTAYRFVYIVLLFLIYYDVDSAYCLYLAFTLVVYGACIPIVVFRTLRKDEDYWQGRIEKNFADFLGPGTRTPSVADIRTPLLGTSIDPPAAQALGDELDRLSEGCETVSFAYLELPAASRRSEKLLGAGGTARVFKGKYCQEPVAIKMLFCLELTEETIRNFFSESKMLCGLRHPNIIHVTGVCVVPPSICMVMELCKGSLRELLELPSSSDLAWGDRLSMATDCARAVACLHAHRPPIVHKDLKSPNFLIGRQMVPSWTCSDVQRWLSTVQLKAYSKAFLTKGVNGKRVLKLTSQSLRRMVGVALAERDDFADLEHHVHELIASVEENPTRVIKVTDLELSKENDTDTAPPSPSRRKSVDFEGATGAAAAGIPETVSWTAPEVIRNGDRAFTRAADVYSLGMVLWELLTGLVPFGDLVEANVDVASMILQDDFRPEIPPDTPKEYADLIRQTWHPDPAERPSAQAVVETLTLMRRRWDTNRTLRKGRFLSNSTNIADKATEKSFLESRFSGKVTQAPLRAGSDYNMGSLTQLNEPLLQREVHSSASGGASRSNLSRHSRTRSDGDAIVKSNGFANFDDLEPAYL